MFFILLLLEGLHFRLFHILIYLTSQEFLSYSTHLFLLICCISRAKSSPVLLVVFFNLFLNCFLTKCLLCCRLPSPCLTNQYTVIAKCFEASILENHHLFTHYLVNVAIRIATLNKDSNYPQTIQIPSIFIG